MFKRGSAAAFTITIALAAAHFGAPTASMAPIVVAGGTHALRGNGEIKPSYTGGCSAYENSTAAKKYEGPSDENEASATRVIDGFFSLDASQNPILPPSVRYAIALAPDPRHTNLSLIFDREMALLVQAAQDQGYDYNSSWLPWKSGSESALTHLGERQYADDLDGQRENCPGVILFRHRDQQGVGAFKSGLVLFVVGEQATGGINQGQWFNALVWLHDHAGRAGDAIPPGDRTLRILGPTFTGSLPSLNRNLQAVYAPDPGKAGDASLPPADLRLRFPFVRILSGSVSSCPAIQSFERDLPRSTAPATAVAPPWRIDFGTFQENDSVHIYRFLKYLREQGTEPGDTAILSEDETAYAALPVLPEWSSSNAMDAGHCEFRYAQDNRPLHLVFPRDISALRNAYEKQAVFDSAKNGLKESAHPILSDGALDGGGQSQITDTIASSSGSVAAVDQEAYLYGLVSILRIHHARYLILRCTNPLDFLFLTRFFHRAYPQARVVTVGSDLLFRREIDTTEFRGVLSLSSYSLLPRAQHWLRITNDKWEEQNHNHLVFQGNIAEGMYLAARYTLQDETLQDPNPDSDGKYPSDIPLIPAPQPGAGPDAQLVMHRAFPVPDYSDPFWLHPDPAATPKFAEHPSTWVSAVGRDGYWPIAIIDQNAIAGICLENEDGRCVDGTPAKAPPLSTVLNLIEPVPARAVDPSGPQASASSSTQHYEFKKASASPEAGSFHHRLKIPLPLSWTIATLLACALLIYQVWGLKKVGVNPADGLFSVFRLSEDPAHGVLLSMGCALALMLLFELGGVYLIPSRFLLASLISGPKNFISIAIVAIVFVVAACLTVTSIVSRKQRLTDVQLVPDARLTARALWTLVTAFTSFVILFVICYGCHLDLVNDVPRFYRMIHLTDGVSPLLPILLLTLGFYLWNWQAIAGDLILAKGCPTLPRLRNERAVQGGWFQVPGFGQTLGSEPVAGSGPNTLQPENTRISHDLGRKILCIAHPFCFAARIVAIPFFIFVAAGVCFEGTANLPLLGLESKAFNEVVDGLLLLALLFSTTEALRLYSTWVMLRKLLLALGRLRLRRTMCRLRPIQADSIWSVSGNVRRVQYDLFRDQLDAANRMMRLMSAAAFGGEPLIYLQNVKLYGETFCAAIESEDPTETSWSTPITPDAPAPTPAGEPPRPLPPLMLRDVLADAVGEVCNRLTAIWDAETRSLNIEGTEKGEDAKKIPLSADCVVCAAEEFVAYHYIAFIQNIVARMRTMTLSMIFLFITVCAAISFYPFVPRTEVSVWLAINLVLIGGAVAYVYAGMERDEILSYIASSEPGRLGFEFYVRLAGFLAGPLIGILTTQFPSITETALQWLQPGLDAIK